MCWPAGAAETAGPWGSLPWLQVLSCFHSSQRCGLLQATGTAQFCHCRVHPQGLCQPPSQPCSQVDAHVGSPGLALSPPSPQCHP